MSAHVLPTIAVNSKSERKVSSLPPLGFEPLIFGMQRQKSTFVRLRQGYLRVGGTKHEHGAVGQHGFGPRGPLLSACTVSFRLRVHPGLYVYGAATAGTG
jgi:hypothetical protein